MVSRDSIRQVLLRMGRLRIVREDLEETFTRGRGAGGQKINKTSSTVRLRHTPTGIEIRCQEERSLYQNRYLARVMLCDRLEARIAAARREQGATVHRARARAATPSRGQKRRMVAEKRRRGEVKAARRRPAAGDD